MKQRYSKKLVIVMISILFLAIIGISFTYAYMKLNPFEKIQLINTSGVALGDDNSIYIISNSNRSISRISGKDQLIYTIEGGNRRADSFYTAYELDSDPMGNLYVLHNRWDDTGSYLETETISEFDGSGKFVKQIFELPDESESKLTPTMRGLKYVDGKLYWYVLVADGIALYNDQSIEPISFYPFDLADQIVQDVDLIDETHWVIASKQGFIEIVDLGTSNVDTIFDASKLTQDHPSSIWGIQYDSNSDAVYFNDLGQFGVFKIKDHMLEKVFSSSDYSEIQNEVYYNFDVTQNYYIAVNDESITLKSMDGTYISVTDLSPSTLILTLRIVAWFSIFFMVISLIFIIKWLFRDVLKSGIPAGFRKTAAIIIMILIATILTSSLAINFYNGILVEQATNNLKILVQSSKFVIHGDSVDAIRRPYDFYNEDYQIVYDDLQRMINYNQEAWNENLYTALYAVSDDRYYALMYNDNSITPYYTFNAWTDDPYFYYFYDAYQGQITQGTETDADGDWLFAMGPVYNSKDEIVAIVEVGMNKYIFDEWNKNIVNKIITDIVSIIIIIILLISEVTFFTEWLEQRKTHRLQPQENQKAKDFNDLNIVRTLALLTYVVIFMCIAFVPLMAKSIYTPIGNLSMSMAIGLPIFTEVLFAAITIVIAGFVAEKRGWKLIFYMGIIILISTAIATALTRSLIIFILIRGIAGIGNGFIQMTMHAFVNTGKTVSQRNETFANMMSGAIAGINLGVVFGANLADKIGYFNVFFVMAGVGVLSIAFERVFLRHYDVMEFHLVEDETDSDKLETSGGKEKIIQEEKMSWMRYFTRKNVVAFFSLILVPAFLCYMYLEYFFPLFAEQRGITTSVIGIVFSLYGLFIVYFGPSMSTFTERTLGMKNASAAASILTGVSLIVYAVTGTLAGAIFAVLILAISDSFGETVYTTYFLALKESQKIGKSIAAGYLEFFSQIGKMLGALAFGIALGFGDQIGIGIIGLVTIGFGLIFIPIGGKVKITEDE